MEIEIGTIPIFDRQYKRLVKKYRSLTNDLQVLKTQLTSKPDAGIDLGNGFRKIRLAISSKNKGKSGGARVITHCMIVKVETYTILLVAIYDKSEESTISTEELKRIVSNYLNN